ncbi:hypothetical protein HAP47_0013335 [Bradyrhizobium sp. 41S5]|uniref:hypothetical protein n=1 Tax=Bradyrhizobium sp. 41S5 TaxID=1404443 RepID=UPI00156B8587|nr:hypothetical protein [Bradyrhizobium sp. 41S5]UFX47588.1 hypothetical protein HAP47_0013335 [Bradyrhizobium sp. 41S5]
MHFLPGNASALLRDNVGACDIVTVVTSFPSSFAPRLRRVAFVTQAGIELADGGFELVERERFKTPWSTSLWFDENVALNRFAGF